MGYIFALYCTVPVFRRLRYHYHTERRTTTTFSTRLPLSIKMPKAASKATSKAKSTRGDKKKKDPNAPKRGLSAYMFFANEQRENVREENPGISFGQVGKVLGDRWKALSEKQREPYEKKAATDKKRYEDEKAKYNAAASDEDETSHRLRTLTDFSHLSLLWLCVYSQ